MLTRPLLTLIATATILTANARTVGELFADTRADNVFKMLPAVTRMDMIDYYNASMANMSKNALDGHSRITALNDTVLSMQYAAGVNVDVVHLDGRRPVLMVIETMPLPEPDSRITFYDESWQPLKTSPLEPPLLADWLTAEGLKNRVAVEQAIPFMTSTATFNTADNTLTFTRTINQYFADRQPDELGMMLPALTYRWNGTKFTLSR